MKTTVDHLKVHDFQNYLVNLMFNEATKLDIGNSVLTKGMKLLQVLLPRRVQVLINAHTFESFAPLVIDPFLVVFPHLFNASMLSTFELRLALRLCRWWLLLLLLSYLLYLLLRRFFLHNMVYSGLNFSNLVDNGHELLAAMWRSLRRWRDTSWSGRKRCVRFFLHRLHWCLLVELVRHGI